MLHALATSPFSMEVAIFTVSVSMLRTLHAAKWSRLAAYWGIVSLPAGAIAMLVRHDVDASIVGWYLWLPMLFCLVMSVVVLTPQQRADIRARNAARLKSFFGRR